MDMTKKIDIRELTPIEYRDGFYMKRDDKFDAFGAHGGKARSAFQLMQDAISCGYSSVTTAGSRFSPQCEIVSTLCESMGVKAHLFMPNGKNTSVIDNILRNKNSVIHRTKVGYNSVIIHDAIDFSEKNNSFYIQFGMECVRNIEVTMHQVRNIPKEVKRIVVPCGSGMSMISIIKGLEYYGFVDKEVVGVVVGKNPQKTFERFVKNDLFERTDIAYRFEYSEMGYDDMVKDCLFCGVELDPIYEAKCLPFLQKGDLLWIVGKRI